MKTDASKLALISAIVATGFITWAVMLYFQN